MAETKLVEMVSEIVSAYVSNNKVEPSYISGLIQSVYHSLSTASEPPPPTEEATSKPTATQIKKSIQQDGLVSFIDGKKY